MKKKLTLVFGDDVYDVDECKCGKIELEEGVLLWTWLPKKAKVKK